MRLSRALNDKTMDLRLRDKLLGEGRLTVKEVENYLNALGDDQSNVTYIEDSSSESNQETTATE